MALHIDYLQPAGAGQSLVARAEVAERLPREDVFVTRVVAADTDQVVARASSRATRRPC